MANTTKRYIIEIEMGAAQQALTDTTKKLQAFDKELDGLDIDSDAAKKIIAEMGKLAKQVEQAEGEIDKLSRGLDGLKPGTLPALEAEIEELEETLRQATRGTAEFDAALLKLGDAKGELKKIEDQIDAIADVKQHTGAFLDFSNGVVGAFSVASVAAQTWGLSSQTVEQYQTKLLSCITVLDSVEQVSKALNSETLGVVKSTLAAGKAYLFGAESASTASKITRAALISTGIGAIVVLVGLLAANFDKVKEAGASIYAKFKPQFEAISRLIGSIVDEARNLASVVTFGLIDSAASHAIKAAQETADKLLEIQTQTQERDIELRKAQGLRTEQEELTRLENLVKIARKKAKDGSEEKLQDLVKAENALAVLKATFATKAYEAEQAATLARLNARVATETAKGKDSITAQLAVKQEELIQLLAAENRNEAAIIAKRAEIESITLAHQKAAADARLAAEFEAFKKRVTETDKLETLSAQERLRRDIATEEERQKGIADRGQQMSTAAGKVTEQTAAEIAERVRIAAIPKLSFTDNVLVRVFGVAPEQLEKTKQQIEAAAQAVNQAVGQYYAGAMAEADARVDEAQQRLSLISQALDQSRQKREADEAQLASATGARRDYLLQKIAKERAEEEKLNNAKNKAAADEKKRLKEQQQLQKESQRVSLALTAALAIQAAVEAIAQAAAIPFPANIPAIIVVGATVASGVFAAKALGNTFADGGFITGPGGPRSDEVPALLSNGEFVVNADATAKNRGLLEMMNANNNRVLPPGTLSLAAGGSGGTSAGSSSGGADFGQLIEQGREQLDLMKQLIGHAAETAAKPPLLIGPAEAIAFEEQRKSVEAAKASAAW
ncbi:hypothetical protein Q5H92_21850 [Hymenobacter sp. M29]|uniref:Bacteriophage tail tape measure N-terminal domain-containing protein n=1 Tax=Hymenobacter mellowenesis TaxID=3063995 RepID=A0ABT9AGQ2_9BACT|nr:hypothetical protein [Hymenobacter sp. M29]MDO7849024.1 hypothetical protein [Hymenobacter sp. M29]